MRVDSKKYILSFLLVILVGLLFYMNNLKKEYEADLKNFKEFQHISSSLILLKNRYENKEEIQKLLNRLKQRFKSKNFKVRGKTYILEFDGLSSGSFNSLFKIVLNSNIFIKTLKITKNKKTASLYMEVEI